MVAFGTITLVAFVAAVLSNLVTAAIAFVAPLFNHGVKLAEFRQAWINEQRNDVAEYVRLAREWVETWDRTNRQDGGRTEDDETELFGLANKALVILWRIQMRMNPLDTNPQFTQDQELLRLLGILIEPPPPGHTAAENRWRPLATAAIAQAQLVFKTEWEVTKKSMLQAGFERYQAWRQQRPCL